MKAAFVYSLLSVVMALVAEYEDCDCANDASCMNSSACSPGNESNSRSNKIGLDSHYVALQFMSWAIKYNKKYETLEDYKLRATIFTETLKQVEEQNKKDVSLKFGLNHMSDWLPEEFEATLGLKD